jgi:hypothetical protein
VLLKAFLKAWIRQREKPRVQVTDIFAGAAQVFLENYRTIHSKEQAQHPGMRGTLYEQLLQDFLRDHLPQRFYVGSGQVLSSLSAMDAQGLFYNLSRQIDVVIFDALNIPRLLPKYELFPIEGTLAVIEVKSKLNKAKLIGTKKETGVLENIESVKRLTSQEAQTITVPPRQVDMGEGRLVELQHMDSPFGAIFAFESINPKTLVEYMKNWNATRQVRYRVDLICLLEKQALIVDTNRIHRLFDPHQLITRGDPIELKGRNRLLVIETPHVLFCFFVLLLRELRKMSRFSEQLTGTTHSSYMENKREEKIRFPVTFEEDNALDPIIADIVGLSLGDK